MISKWVTKANAMLPAPGRPEIDEQTIKFVVGVIAIGLPILTSIFAQEKLTSISAAYYEEGWSQSIFIGFLFAIAAFLAAYNGLTKPEMVLSKVASVAALGVALFPCGCDGKHGEPVPHVHEISTAAMFVILTCFCWIFFGRSKKRGYPEAKVRAVIYWLCGIAMVLSLVVFLLHAFCVAGVCDRWPRLMFCGEFVGLVAFGISWFTASHVLPGLATKDERRDSVFGRKSPAKSSSPALP